MIEADYMTQLENAECIVQNLDYDVNRLYVILAQTAEGFQFGSLHPIIPEFFWTSAEGKKYKNEIKRVINENMCKHLSKHRHMSCHLKLVEQKITQCIDVKQLYADNEHPSDYPEHFETYANMFDQNYNQKL